MANLSIGDVQQNFARLDLIKLESVADSLSNDKERALEFVTDPSAFMRREMGGDSVSAHWHCHVEIDGRMYPQEAAATKNRIYFGTQVQFSREVWEAIKLRVKSAHKDSSSIKVNDCDKQGCGECAVIVARVSGD